MAARRTDVGMEECYRTQDQDAACCDCASMPGWLNAVDRSVGDDEFSKSHKPSDEPSCLLFILVMAIVIATAVYSEKSVSRLPTT